MHAVKEREHITLNYKVCSNLSSQCGLSYSSSTSQAQVQGLKQSGKADVFLETDLDSVLLF